MAFGLGFDKAKILQSAEKYVIQGKIPAAIEEYRKIVKKDPKDLMTLNAIGDLYMRIGKNDDALSTFHTLAEKSVESGMVPRAIAVYKRITKLDPESLVALEKLGELYSMQGLMRDSRTYFMQAVDIHVRRRDPEKARTVFERVLMLDMDNPKLLKRMGDLYAETRKEREALSTYLSATERYLDSNEPDQALAVLDAIYKIDPINADASILKGRAFLEQGKPAEAIKQLEGIPDYQQNKSALSALFHAFAKQGDTARAEEVANLLLDQHEEVSALDVLAAGLLDRNDDDAALAVYQRVADRLQGRTGLAPIADGLRRILDRDSKNKAALELLWKVYKQAGDLEQGRSIGEQLAHLALEEGEPNRAHDIYSELSAAEPENYELAQQLRRIDARYATGGSQATLATESTPFMAIEEVAEAGQDSSHIGGLPPREQLLVRNSITESELYQTYHQVPKAIEILETCLAEVPGDVTLYEHLLPLYEQTQQYGKALKAAEALTEAYVKAGDGDRASRYGELLLGYQTKLHEAAAVADLTQIAVEAEPAATEPQPEAVAPSESQVREVDLSMEWNSLSSAPANASTNSVVEEIDFYLQAELPAEAQESIRKLRGLEPEHASLEEFQRRLDTMVGRSAAVTEVTMPDWGTPQADGASSEDVPAEAPAADTSFTAPEPPLQTEFSAASAPESVIETDSISSTEPVPEQASAFAPTPQMDAELDLELSSSGTSPSNGFELALEDHSPISASPSNVDTPSSFPSTAAQQPTPPTATIGGGLLDDLFAEFRDKVETPQPGGGGDLETHYNMGVAFKEMALYDEAIGEFQKVQQIAEQAKDYSHVIQCCSLLALCFIEKGLPRLAVNWYETALKSPGVDADASLALMYEMGAAYELAGDRPAALKSFMDVYSRNIDYRNVAERIRELQQAS
jgi:tetratricopeptide (TPR) repeat protein